MNAIFFDQMVELMQMHHADLLAEAAQARLAREAQTSQASMQLGKLQTMWQSITDQNGRSLLQAAWWTADMRAGKLST